MFTRDVAAPNKPHNGFDLSYLYEDKRTGPVEVWPENWPVVGLFSRLLTQWRYSFSGREGLDYAAVYPLLDRMGLSPRDWDHMLDDLQVLEGAALTQMRANQT